MTQYQSIPSAAIGPTFDTSAGAGTLATALLAVLLIMVVAGAIFGFRRAYVRYKKAKRGLIADDPQVHMKEMRRIGTCAVFAVGLMGLMWMMPPSILTGAVDLKKATGRELCGVERHCTMEDLVAAWSLKP